MAIRSGVLEAVSLDLLVNNAGIRPEECGPDKKISEIDFAAMQGVLTTNMIGPMRVLAACLPALQRASAFKVVISAGMNTTSS